MPLRPLTPPGGWLAECLQLTRGWRRRSRSGGNVGGRAADGVRRPGGSSPGPSGAAGPLLRAVARLLRPAQVDDARCALLPPLPTGARHSPALVCAGGREPWCSWLSTGATTSSGRLEGAGGAWGCALRVALDVMPSARVQDAHDFLAGTRAGRLRVKTGVSRWPDGPGYTPLALSVQGDAMDVLSMAASSVRSTLPPLHPHPHSRGRLSAEICWLGRNMRGMRVT